MNRLLAKTEPDPDTCLPEQPTDCRGPSHLTTSQAAAFARLAAMAELACHPVRYAGIAVRAVPLLLGQSGVGKTVVISRLADHLGTPGNPLPMLHMTGPGWVIFQARAEPATLTVLLAFIRRHGPRPGKPRTKGPAGLIFVDELDKAVAPGDKGTDAYSLAITGELLALLDKDDRLLSAGWGKQDIALLQAFMIVGAGAWQLVVVDGAARLDPGIQRFLDPGGAHVGNVLGHPPNIPVGNAKHLSDLGQRAPGLES